MIDVAFAADATYVPHAATLLRSLTASNDPEAVQAHFLHPRGVSARSIELVRGMVERAGAAIAFHEIAPAAVAGLPAMGRISQVMWYRLLLPGLLPGISRVLYLDCDTLVLDTLAPLWELDMNGAPIAAVTNVFPQDLLGRPEQLGLEPGRYFNSGVLLMDLDAWRACGCGEEVARLAREEPARLVFPDQDALNIVLGPTRLALHPRWNAQNSVFYFSWAEDAFGAATVREARENPAIVHFEGPEHAKPWHYRSTHPYQRIYLEYRAQTPWPKVRLEGRTLGSRLRRSARTGSR